MYCAKGSGTKENLTYSTYYPPNARRTYSSNEDIKTWLIIEDNSSKGDSREVERLRIRAYRFL